MHITFIIVSTSSKQLEDCERCQVNDVWIKSLCTIYMECTLPDSSVKMVFLHTSAIVFYISKCDLLDIL